ncbi:MAG TPA: hypothetical protein VJ044_12600 [Candidatus Hodarchaeales archaeon]|nr:hypothetical protein [Candidatus Hodarchaeales archaeon]
MAVDKPTEDEIQQVTIDDVLREAPVQPFREIPPLARIGYQLAKLLLIYLSGVTVFILADYWYHANSLPKEFYLESGQVALYKELSQIVEDRTLKILDALVLKGFLPVLTAVLGYIFGSSAIEKN